MPKLSAERAAGGINLLAALVAVACGVAVILGFGGAVVVGIGLISAGVAAIA